MTNTFKNAELDITTSFTDAYECPTSTTAVVTLAQVAAVDGTILAAGVAVQWTDDSNSDKATVLVQDLDVPKGAAVGVLSGKLVLEAGDKIQAKADVINDAQLSISVMEIS